MLFNYNIINNSCYSIINNSPGTPAPPTGHHFPAHNFGRFLLYLRWCLFQGPTERTTHSCLTLPKADPTGPTASFPLSSISQLTTLAEYFCYTGVHFKLRILETKHIPRNQDTRQVFGNQRHHWHPKPQRSYNLHKPQQKILLDKKTHQSLDTWPLRPEYQRGHTNQWTEYSSNKDKFRKQHQDQ